MFSGMEHSNGPSPCPPGLRFTWDWPLGCLASDILILALSESTSLLWERTSPREVGGLKAWRAKQTWSFHVNIVPHQGVNGALLLMSPSAFSHRAAGIAWWPEGLGTGDRMRLCVCFSLRTANVFLLWCSPSSVGSCYLLLSSVS